MQQMEYLVEQLYALGKSTEDAKVVSVAVQQLLNVYYGVAKNFDVDVIHSLDGFFDRAQPSEHPQTSAFNKYYVTYT